MVQAHPRSVEVRQAGWEHTHAAMRMETAMLSLTQPLASGGGNLHHEWEMLSIVSAGDLDSDMSMQCVKDTRLWPQPRGMVTKVGLG
jgi:hypothetical protein